MLVNIGLSLVKGKNVVRIGISVNCPVFILFVLLVNHFFVLRENVIVTINDGCEGNQNLDNRENEESKLVQQTTSIYFVFICVIVVNIMPVDRNLCNNEDYLKHTEADNSLCHTTHDFFGLDVLIVEPSVYTAHKENVKTYKDEQQAL